MLFGFYFLLVFVVATIIAGIYGEPTALSPLFSTFRHSIPFVSVLLATQPLTLRLLADCSQDPLPIHSGKRGLATW